MKTRLWILTLSVLMLALSAQAQTATSPTPPPPSTSNGFAGASEAVAIHYNGEWSAATDVSQSFDFLDFGKTKTNHVYLEGHELIAPGPEFNIYAGGIRYEPDLSSLFKKTNIQPGSVSAFFSGAVGNGVPSNGGSHISFLASNGFAGASEAVAIHYNGEWSAATDVSQSFDFLDFGKTKTNHVYLEGHELIAPGPEFNIYAGGIRYEPDLSSLFKKTNIQPGSVSAFFSGAVGNGVPSNGGSHISFLAGGGLKYNLTSNLSWQSLEAQYGRFGSNEFVVISTGLSFIFAGK